MFQTVIHSVTFFTLSSITQNIGVLQDYDKNSVDNETKCDATYIQVELTGNLRWTAELTRRDRLPTSSSDTHYIKFNKMTVNHITAIFWHHKHTCGSVVQSHSAGHKFNSHPSRCAEISVKTARRYFPWIFTETNDRCTCLTMIEVVIRGYSWRWMFALLSPLPKSKLLRLELILTLTLSLTWRL